MYYRQDENDELRARFTAWLIKTVYHAKLDYLKKLERQLKTISIDDVPQENLSYEAQYQSGQADSFEFEEERLAKAYSELPIKRQEILTMLFVEDKSPKEIAKQLNCSIQHVYNQQSLALKKLRHLLTKGGEEEK